MAYSNDSNFKYIQFVQESKNQSKEKSKENMFITDFKENINGKQKDFIVTIEGIHVTVTGNNTKYTESELRGSPSNLTGVHSWTSPYENPVLTHHNQHDGEPIGRVIEANFSNSTLSGKPGIILKAKIDDQDAIEKIKDGRYQTVSVGGNVAAAECSICGIDWVSEGWCEHSPGREYEGEVMNLIMKDITFVEVSFVNVPADEYANIIAYDTVENNKENDNSNNEYISATAFKKDTFSENQGGTNEGMAKNNEQTNSQKEKLKIKEEKIDLLESKLENKEKKVKELKEKNKDLNDKVELLEGDIENYQDEITELNEQNQKLKEQQVSFLSEKIIDKKIELDRIPEELSEEKREELIERLNKKSREFLKDLLEDLKYDQKLQSEDYDGFNNEQDNESKQNSDEENVETEEEEKKDVYNIEEELKNL